MLIMSQNRERLLNLYTLEELKVGTRLNSNPNGENVVWIIEAMTSDYSGINLGSYPTKERALEVLVEISERAGAINTYKLPKE